MSPHHNGLLPCLPLNSGRIDRSLHASSAEPCGNVPDAAGPIVFRSRPATLLAAGEARTLQSRRHSTFALSELGMVNRGFLPIGAGT